MITTEPTIWTGCYDDSWKGVIVDEAFAHPAKVARGLVRRIYAHLFARGLLSAGDCVVDPFGGIAGTALDAMLGGCHWFGCELEAKANGGSPFVELGNENIAKWAALGMPGTAVLVQGDSRKLCENLGALMERDASVAAVLSSPPYAECIESRIGPSGMKVVLRSDGSPMGYGKSEKQMNAAGYGNTDGNLGSMKSGSVEDAIAVVVGSPPYSEGLGHGGAPTRGDGRGDDVSLDAMQNGYGTSDGQLSAMPTGSVDAVVSSPPFQGAHGGAVDADSLKGVAGMGRSQECNGYGQSDGNLSAMQAGEVADCLVGSPPFSAPDCQPASVRQPGGRQGVRTAYRAAGSDAEDNYGTTEGQLGNESGETFWSASRTIVEQCYTILKPGGVAVWIVKAFVRKGEIVDFPGDWQRLCEACGFEAVEVVHASLVKETRTPDLFGGEVVKRKERKSFFRRLAEKKGSPEINEEVVLFMRKVPQ